MFKLIGIALNLLVSIIAPHRACETQRDEYVLFLFRLTRCITTAVGTVALSMFVYEFVTLLLYAEQMKVDPVHLQQAKLCVSYTFAFALLFMYNRNMIPEGLMGRWVHDYAALEKHRDAVMDIIFAVFFLIAHTGLFPATIAVPVVLLIIVTYHAVTTYHIIRSFVKLTVQATTYMTGRQKYNEDRLNMVMSKLQ